MPSSRSLQNFVPMRWIWNRPTGPHPGFQKSAAAETFVSWPGGSLRCVLCIWSACIYKIQLPFSFSSLLPHLNPGSHFSIPRPWEQWWQQGQLAGCFGALRFATKILPTVSTISRDTPCSIHATSGESHRWAYRSPVARIGGWVYGTASSLRRLLWTGHSSGLLVGWASFVAVDFAFKSGLILRSGYRQRGSLWEPAFSLDDLGAVSAHLVRVWMWVCISDIRIHVHVHRGME